MRTLNTDKTSFTVFGLLSPLQCWFSCVCSTSRPFLSLSPFPTLSFARPFFSHFLCSWPLENEPNTKMCTTNAPSHTMLMKMMMTAMMSNLRKQLFSSATQNTRIGKRMKWNVQNRKAKQKKHVNNKSAFACVFVWKCVDLNWTIKRGASK